MLVLQVLMDVASHNVLLKHVHDFL